MLERFNAGLLLSGSCAMAQEGSARACVANIQAFCGEVQPGQIRDLRRAPSGTSPSHVGIGWQQPLRARKRPWLTSSKTAPSRSDAAKS